jgi:FkbM family methyltransferase
MPDAFFDSYPLFYDTGISSGWHRLNARFDCLIARHREHIVGRTVLDVGSHDGRWTLAALATGASYVTAIEPRPDLVDIAEMNLGEYGFEQAQFLVGGALDTLTSMKPKVDTVFLFGVFYHVHQHISLLKELSETNATTIIIDTFVTPARGEPSYIRSDREPSYGGSINFHTEPVDQDGTSFEEIYPGAGVAIVGRPSRQAVLFFLRQLGFSAQEIPWRPYLRKWSRRGLIDYAAGRRASFLAIRA